MTRSRAGAVLAAALILATGTGCAMHDDAESLRGELPAALRDSGTLTVGTAAPYAPLVFAEDGRLTGFDVDVVTAVADRLGLTAEFTERPFVELIPGVVAETFTAAARGMFATRERQQSVDQVTYHSAGTQWLRKSGSTLDPTAACGRRIGALNATVQFTVDLPAKSAACTDTGGPAVDVVGFDTLDQAVEAVRTGAVDGFSGDSPVVLSAAKTSGGALEPAGDAFDTEPIAIAVAKGSPLGAIVQKAVQQLIDSGELRTIAEKWGLQDGLITESRLDGALI
ncbi:MAG: ABC transporter substrate-binding protein [Gordonia sp. (in: high G+C Gram-positive bacteria)]|uniref:ABC transporter substrate-binding protein n=1 Tax=Gordonia sp. (in: high G+C Gram-positive bacteria) TaxID=84139 RepID=UPI0039E5EF0C